MKKKLIDWTDPMWWKKTLDQKIYEP